MKSDFGKLGMLLSAAVAAAGALLIGAVYGWAGVCTGMLKLATGAEVHMKCFYSGQALVLLGALLVVNGVMMLLTKNLPHGGVIAVVAGIFAIIVVSNSGLGIGICAKVMACHDTAAWAKFCGGLAAAAGAASLVLGLKSR